MPPPAACGAGGGSEHVIFTYIYVHGYVVFTCIYEHILLSRQELLEASELPIKTPSGGPAQWAGRGAKKSQPKAKIQTQRVFSFNVSPS